MTYKRVCVKCGVSKAVGEFYLRRGRCGPLFNRECRACTYERTKLRAASGTQAYRSKMKHKDSGWRRKAAIRERWRKHREQTGTALTLAQYLQGDVEHRPACLLVRAVAALSFPEWAPVRIEHPMLPPAETSAQRWRRRYRTEPAFAARERMRRQARKHGVWGCIQSRVRDAVKRERHGRRRSALFEFLGYSPDDLRNHIERQFDRRMSWAKFLAGEIHIDHVRPASSFDLSKEDQIKACWALPNLRPCWAKENIRKAAKHEFLL